jgi:predicted nucleic acid-binding protein
MDFLVETDMFVEYLTTENSALRHALSKGVCYTTFQNALELFAAATSLQEEEAIQQALMSIRLLGLNWRNAKPFALSARRIEERTGEKLSEREMIIIGMAEMSKLTILTSEHFERYSSFGVAVTDRAK